MKEISITLRATKEQANDMASQANKLNMSMSSFILFKCLTPKPLIHQPWYRKVLERFGR